MTRKLNVYSEGVMSSDNAPQQQMRTALASLFSAHRLPPSQRQITSWLLDHAHLAANLSSTDLAARVGVSQPSVTRFAANLGFAGYPEFRSYLHDLLIRSTSPQELAAPNELQLLVDSEIENLLSLRANLTDATDLNKAAHALAFTQPLVVVGVRVAASLATQFGYFAAKLLPDVRVVTGSGSATTEALSRAHAAGAEWILVFALPRYPAELENTLQAAKKVGLNVILVTDRASCPLVEYADILLTAPVAGGFVFDSTAAVSVLTVSLLHQLVKANPTPHQRQLELFDATAAAHDIFLD
jgi:DNA-binding MurR/RpiR family transcriptional regulator